MQLKINSYDETIFEWISYKEFSEIKEIAKDSSITVYSAIWRDGPLYWNKQDEEYTRISSKVFLKRLHNSQDSIELLINKV
jgi:hypothetical protein